MLVSRLLGLIIAFIFRLYSATFRYRFFFENEADKSHILNSFAKHQCKNPLLMAFFHQEEIPLLGACLDKRVHVMVSKSKDGEIMSTVLKEVGYETIRGSSSRGGVKALLDSIKAVKKGHHFALAVDGPRGPIYKVKPGIIKISQKSKNPITPVRCSVQKKWISKKSWNKGVLPKPFSRIDFHFLETKIYKDQDELENKLKSFPIN